MWIIFIGLCFVAFNVVFYAFLVPSLESRPRFVSKELGKAVYVISYILSILRVPLALVPYLIKLLIYLVFKTNYLSSQNSYIREGIHIIRDVANLWGSMLLVRWIFGEPNGATFILYLPIVAEAIRLITYRGQMLFSATWQYLPHYQIASNKLIVGIRVFRRYCYYYSLDQEARGEYLLKVLRRWAFTSLEMQNCLAYVSGFRIVSTSKALNGGDVRDIALGEIFVHPNWTNDPWLMIGLAIRRSPWIFDPRNLHRPFYYRTGSNVLVNRFIFRHLDYCMPYVVYQFGHQIKVGRYDPFYRVLRWLGIDLEEKVRKDGTYQYDQFMRWIGVQLGISPRVLYQLLPTDEEVLNEVAMKMRNGENPSMLDIATSYSYPLKYVEEVLWSRIQEAHKTM